MVAAQEMRRIMFSKFTLFRFLLLASILLAPSTFAWAGSDDAPPWLKQAAQISTPVYDKEVPAVVLLDDETVTVYEDGRVETTNNYAIRILTSVGKAYANASA